MYKDETVKKKLRNWFMVYGMGCYSPSKFKEPRNSRLLKPETGGLWSSPKKSLWGWKDWCDSEMFFKGWGFKLAKIYMIDSIQDFDRIPEQPAWIDDIDWEKFSKVYDGMEFSSWDCESLLIFNLDCISFVKSLRLCELLIHSHTYNQ